MYVPCAARASSQAGRRREGEVAPHTPAHSKQGQALSRGTPGGRGGGRAETPIQTYLDALRSGLHCTAVRRTCQERFCLRSAVSHMGRAQGVSELRGLGSAHQDALSRGAGRASVGCDPTVASAPVGGCPRRVLSLEGPAGSGSVAARRRGV